MQARMSPAAAGRELDPSEAKGLIPAVMAAMESLERLLAEETMLLKSGHVAEGLAHEARKAELAGAYMQGLEAIKANALFLSRVAPDQIAALKAAHGRFSTAVDLNQTVIATARAVSEGLLRTLAAEAGGGTKASGYGPPGKATEPQRATGQPSSLVMSRKI